MEIRCGGYARIDLKQYVSSCFFVIRAVFGNEAAWCKNPVLDAPPCHPRRVYGVIVMPFCIMFPQTAQDESRSISENSTWGIRRRFEQGKLHINHTKFLGYDKNKDGNLVINEKQAKIVRRIYTEFLDGKGASRIARASELDGV